MIEIALQFPDLKPEIFTLGPFELAGLSLGPFALRWYALAYIAGLLLGWRYITNIIRNQQLWGGRPGPATAAQLDDFLVWATLGVILGGRLGYVVFYKPDMLWKAPLDVPAIWQGGMSFHGGLIGVGLAIFLFSRRSGVPLFSLADLAAAATPIGLFFGRIANFINAELYGRASDLPWAIKFPTYDMFGQPGFTDPRHPSQLYEAVLEGIVLFIILRVMTHRNGALQRPGMTTGVFLLGYGFFRFMVEFVREPDQHMPEALRGYLTMGMLLCVPMILAGLWLIQRARRAAPSPA
jgi:phosphatidylglycerol:prolipoprotein diacylglycerol transferase